MDLEKFSISTNISDETFAGKSKLLPLLCFSNFDEFFPLFDSSSKTKLLNQMILEEACFFISEMDLTAAELEFGKIQKRKFPHLNKIKIDDYNLNQFIRHWEIFKNIRILEIITSVEIFFEFSQFKNLENFTLINSEKELKNIPNINGVNLKFLCLNGFKVEFRGKLPDILELTDCYVRTSTKLEGCRKMKLFTVLWENPSLPYEELYIEDIDFQNNYPHDFSKLKILHINNCSTNLNTENFINLTEIRCTGQVTMVSPIVFSDTIKKIIIDIEVFSNFPKDLEKLCLREFGNNFENTTKIDTLILSNSIFDIENLILTIKNIEIGKLIISYSQIYFKNNSNLSKIKFPKSIKTIIVNQCIVKNSFYCENPEDDQKILSYKTPQFSTYNIFQQNFYQVDSEVYEMSKKEFLVYCNSNKNKIFNEFNKVYLDLLKLKDFEPHVSKYDQFINLLGKFPFKISSTVFKYFSDFSLVLQVGNDGTKILFQNFEKSLSYLKNLMETHDNSDQLFNNFIKQMKNSR